MKNWISAGLVFFLGMILAGCSTMSATNSAPNPDSSKEYIGIFSGAILGGLTGSALGQKGGGRLTAIGLGAAAGALIGFFVGKYMSDLDHDKALVQAGKNPYAQSSHAGRQQANAWRQASHPLVPKMTAAASTLPLGARSEQDKKITAKTEKPQPKASARDQFLSLWRTLPSPQWFVNDDMKQQELS